MKKIDVTFAIKIEEEIKKQHKVLLNTEHCKSWKIEHNDDCNGCPSFLGCTKIENLIMLEQAKTMGLIGYDYFYYRVEILQEKEIRVLDKFYQEIKEIIDSGASSILMPAGPMLMFEFIEDEKEIPHITKSFWDRFMEIVWKIIKRVF